MRKRIVPRDVQAPSLAGQDWLNLEDLVEVEVTSEDRGDPGVEGPRAGAPSGWRSAGPGDPTIRLLFAQPQPLRRILLEFSEPDIERTQEFVLRWSADGGRPVHELVRQQWNFSPQGATRQIEDQLVDLAGVTMLELSIIPDISLGPAHASLEHLRLA